MERVLNDLRNVLGDSKGFELHPFKVGWYNATVAPIFKLPYPEDTLAVLVISAPRMFEKVFIPYLRENYTGKTCDDLETDLNDPLDRCMQDTMQLAVEELKCVEQRPEIIHDFSLTPNRRPRILMPTCGHISGSSYYYQKSQLADDPWPEKRSIGLGLHPKYGGWFAFRAALIFPGVETPASFEQKAPEKTLRTDEEIKDALEKFIFHWQDWTYRDVTNPVEKYSQEQRDYFGTLPGSRWKVVSSILDSQSISENS